MGCCSNSEHRALNLNIIFPERFPSPGIFNQQSAMLLDKLKYKLPLLALCLISFAFTGCSLFQDDLEECPAGLRLRFVFNYNLLKADAFSTQVNSVNVWAFDKNGTFVWSGAASGDALAEPGYVMETPLGEGTYDFIAWCGLLDNADFNLQTYTPSSKQDLEVKLQMLEKDGKNISSSHFKGLFNGSVSNVTYVVDPMKPSIMTVTVPLIKDTNDIVVMLANLNGKPLDRNDFTVSFTYADSWLAWDNQVIPGCPTVDYTPWSSLYGETTLAPINSKAGEVRSTLLFEMSSSRLIQGANAYLDVVRTEDNVTIIHIPLIEYFLLEKGTRYDEFGDQEYLDRRDDYSILFFIDSNKTWYIAAGIYINSWAIVPPQNENA